MNRLLLLLVIAVAACGRLGRAQLPLSAAIAAGVAPPVGDLARVIRPGYQIAGMIGYAPLQRLELRAEAAHYAFDGNGVAPDLRVLEVSGNLRVELSRHAIISPYAIGGVGASRSRFARADAPAENDIAANVGAGVAAERGRIRLFSELRFHNIFSGANDSNDSRRFAPLTVGVAFR